MSNGKKSLFWHVTSEIIRLANYTGIAMCMIYVDTLPHVSFFLQVFLKYININWLIIYSSHRNLNLGG